MPHRGGSDDAPVDDARIEEERRLMYVAITRAQRSLHLNWCKKRKRARETVVCEPSRFIPEMGLDEAPPPTADEAPMSTVPDAGPEPGYGHAGSPRANERGKP